MKYDLSDGEVNVIRVDITYFVQAWNVLVDSHSCRLQVELGRKHQLNDFLTSWPASLESQNGGGILSLRFSTWPLC